ncbi:hypothetical protein HID58_063688 [Brassica napus]|uniref:F-box domain-containing protein n=1 Tax=Brassica napus TaxID=3708 RepID=A0ABQ7XF53_BRANA|nr:hypothetical protein HID58_063688 [Brassica napus]
MYLRFLKYFVSTDKPKRYPFSLSKKKSEIFHLHLSISNDQLWYCFTSETIRLKFRDPRFYPSSCESLPSIATIGGLTEAARLGTSQAELKDGTTRAPIIRSLRNVGCHFQHIYEATNCSLYIGREKMAMYGSVVTPVWCNGDGHGNQSDDSPDMDVIGISVIRRDIGNKVLKTSVSGLVELNILKNLTVYVVAGSLGQFKSHASNIVFDEHSENILPSSEGDVGLAASSGPSVLGDKVDEECAAADPPEISDAQNNRKRCLQREGERSQNPNPFEMSLTAIDSGQEPPSKKPAIEPTTNLPLPEELVLGCLARVSRSHYPILSLVSKIFRSLTSSPVLYQTRSLLNRTENCLYVCLQFPNDPNLRWFTLYRKPDKALNNKKKKKKETSSGYVLGQVRIGHRLYAISDGPCSSNVFFLDCRTHAWVETPSLRFDHSLPECGGMMYLPGGSENPDSLKCVEVFNVMTQIWNPVPPEEKIFRLRDLQGRAYKNNDVVASRRSPVVVRLKDYTLHLVGSDTLCLIENTFYRYDASSSGKLFTRYSNVYLVESGGKLVVFWDTCVPARGGFREKTIWCAEISLETGSGDGVWGKVEWFDAVLTVPKSYKFVYAIAATL